MNKAVTGKLGELAAGRYLRENGYEIITANYRCRLGEIDIIAKQNKTNIYALLRLKRDLKIISTHLPTPLLFLKGKR